MENIIVIIEDIKSLRKNAKDMLERADRLEKSIFAIKQAERKEKENKTKKMLKELLNEVEFQILGLKSDIIDLEDSELFRDKIKIPKHTK